MHFFDWLGGTFAAVLPKDMMEVFMNVENNIEDISEIFKLDFCD